MMLSTPRLVLRDLRRSDAASIAKHINDREIAINLLAVPHPYALKDAREFLACCAKNARKQKPSLYNFALELKSEHQFIGCIGLRNVDNFNGTCTLGYWLARPFHRQGLMSEAIAAILKFAFVKLKLRRIGVHVFVENRASNSLLKKMGFVLEGTAKSAARDRATGTIHDDNFYGLLKEDWLKRT